MDSIRSPGKLLIQYLESIWSPSGVHLQSTWTSLKWSNCVLPKNPARLQVYSRYTPLGVLMESIRSDTIPGLLKKSFNTEAGLCPDSTSNSINMAKLNYLLSKNYMFSVGFECSTFCMHQILIVHLTTKPSAHVRYGKRWHQVPMRPGSGRVTQIKPTWLPRSILTSTTH